MSPGCESRLPVCSMRTSSALICSTFAKYSDSSTFNTITFCNKARGNDINITNINIIKEEINVYRIDGGLWEATDVLVAPVCGDPSQNGKICDLVRGCPKKETRQHARGTDVYLTRMKTEVMIMRRMPSSTPRMMVKRNVIVARRSSCQACRKSKKKKKKNTSNTSSNTLLVSNRRQCLRARPCPRQRR